MIPQKFACRLKEANDRMSGANRVDRISQMGESDIEGGVVGMETRSWCRWRLVRCRSQGRERELHAAGIRNENGRHSLLGVVVGRGVPLWDWNVVALIPLRSYGCSHRTVRGIDWVMLHPTLI